MRKNGWIRWILVAALFATTVGCAIDGAIFVPAQTGELRRELQTVELGEAREVRAVIRMGAGDLQIDSGTGSLLEAEFVYDVDEWKPEVTYEVDDGSGRLIVRQPSTDQIMTSSQARYSWDLTFNESTPLDLRIDCGAGKSEIDISDMGLTRLDMRLGVGDAVIDVADNPNLTRVDLQLGAGEVEINLNGEWQQDATIDIQGGIGRSRLQLPKDVGVIVRVTKGIGDVDVSGLFRRGDTYVNAAYDEAEVVLDITVRTGIGSVNLDVIE